MRDTQFDEQQKRIKEAHYPDVYSKDEPEATDLRERARSLWSPQSFYVERFLAELLVQKTSEDTVEVETDFLRSLQKELVCLRRDREEEASRPVKEALALLTEEQINILKIPKEVFKYVIQ